MNFLITESQLQIILKESGEEKVVSKVKFLDEYGKNVLNLTKRIYGMNLQFLAKFGSALGGLMVPMNDYIENGNFNMTETQKALVLVGVAATYFLNNKSVINKIVEKIKEEGLMDVFKNCVEKSKDLKNSFAKFLLSTRSTMHTAAEMVSYSFILPIVQDIVNVVTQKQSIEIASMLLAKRLVTSGVVLGGTIAIAELIASIAKKISK